jgi:hypothetical protein
MKALVLGVEVRRVMISVVDLYNNPEENRDDWHDPSSDGCFFPF